MEKIGEEGDDQNSGWLQVKKKHRNSSKFSLQGWVGGTSGKQSSHFLHNQTPLHVKTGKPDGKHGGHPSKAGDFTGHGIYTVVNPTSVSLEMEKGVHYFDKCVVSEDNECTNSAPLGPTTSCPSHLNVKGFPEKGKPCSLQNIKLGGLTEGDLIVNLQRTVAAEIKFGEFGNVHLPSSKSENINSSVSCISTSSKPEDHKLVCTSTGEDHVHQSQRDEENCKEVTEVSSENVKVPITKETLVNSNDDISGSRVAPHEHIKSLGDVSLSPSSLSSENIRCAPGEEAGTMVELPAMCDTGASDLLEVSLVGGSSSSVGVSQDSDSLPSERNMPTSGPKLSASTEEGGHQVGNTILDDFPNAQNANDISTGEAGESKERFRQRLWCFLFENLNRAVDELYLLCELECDLEQVKEAILVLEEAASDFGELNCRVEEFEKLKMSSSHLTDDPPAIMKSDHRRPHALSWEVRRMTTSPHHAEILSSSLEAFRKIQQERAKMRADAEKLVPDCSNFHHVTKKIPDKYTATSDVKLNAKEVIPKSRKQSGASDLAQGSLNREKRTSDTSRSCKMRSRQNGSLPPHNPSISDIDASKLAFRESSATSGAGKIKREQLESTPEIGNPLPKKEKLLTDSIIGRNTKSIDSLKKRTPVSERDEEQRNGSLWKSMDAWKEKRNWEDILTSSFRVSSRFSHSPGMSRRSAERARILHDKLMSPDKKKKTALDLKREAEEKHAQAMRIRSELENERLQKLQRNSEKVNRVNEWQAVRSMKLREGMYARHQRSESRHEAYLAQVVRRAGDESSKVNEVRFITSLNEENKKLMLRQKLHDSEVRRAEKLQVMKSKQKEDMAREEAVLERKRLIEAEKLQRLAETQRKKEEAQLRREEERKASSAAREARAMEQMRRKEFRAKAQQEEAELLAQKLAEKLSESEQRRKFYLEQIRERASMDFRDQSSPLLRRSLNKDQGKSTPTSNGEDYHGSSITGPADSTIVTDNIPSQNSLKRRIKKIRQRLMSLKYEFAEPPVGIENAGIGYRTAVGTARAKIGRWLQELQKLRQARKEGAASIGLITAEMIKFLEGKDPELQACRQTGLLDFIASALPASHTSKPETCLVTIYLLRLLKVVLSVPANRGYFIAQNLLPPIIPMLAAALENYIKIAASTNVTGSTNLLSSKTSVENLLSISEALDGFLWTVATIIGHVSYDERQLQIQDGLQELVIAYQVIHQLRDFFALYDRPQVEGSPFPSSILLSLNLLAILTSRSRTTSSIDWESFPIERVPGHEILRTHLMEAAEVGCFDVNYSSRNKSAVHSDVSLPLPDVPENRPLDESSTTESNVDLVLHKNGADKAEITETRMHTADIPNESQSIVDGAVKSSTSPKDEKGTAASGMEEKTGSKLNLKQPVAFLLSAISETGLVCLPSLLTAVLLQANNRLSSEQASYILPSNFEEVATGVLKVLNNLALIDITFLQSMLGRPDLKMELFHLMSFLLSYCTSKWRVAFDQIGLLLLESLSLLGYFALFHPKNQAVLRWGKSPTILHKVCDLPFVFFSDVELMPVLAGTLVAACFGCDQNKGVVQQELSTDMILSLLKSCRNCLPATESTSVQDDNPFLTDCPNESRKDIPIRSGRYNLRNYRVPSGKNISSANGTRASKGRYQKDGKILRLSEEMSLKPSQSTLESSSILMLHSRFPPSFVHRAEKFFLAEIKG